MLHGVRFVFIRIIILSLWFLSQAYLFLRIHRAITSAPRSVRFKRRAVAIAGIAIILLFAVNAFIVLKHVHTVNPPIPLQVLLFYIPAVWGFGSILSALLLFISALPGRLVWKPRRPPVSVEESAATGLSRRRFIRAGVFGVAAAPFMVSGYGASYTGRGCDIHELMVPFGIPVRVVQLTDIHAGIFMSQNQIRRYVNRTIECNPELFLLTGDFISNSMVFLPGCLEELVRVRTRYGTFASLGNHEHWYGRMKDLRAAFRRFGIPLLNNAHRVIRTEHGPFAVAGIDDLRTGRPDLTKALHGTGPRMPVILLSHRPEIFPEAARRGIRLTISGHYHGGQINLKLPGLDISLARLLTPYPEGHYRIDDSHLYVSRGIGTTFTPIRLNAPPEISLFNLI
jgi:predicted MPP superfamily phosphohydrolase